MSSSAVVRPSKSHAQPSRNTEDGKPISGDNHVPMSIIDISVVLRECSDGRGRAAELFEGFAQLEVDVYVGTGGCILEKVGLVKKELVTHLSEYPSSRYKLPENLKISSYRYKKYESHPSNRLYAPDTLHHDECNRFFVSGKKTHDEEPQYSELMAFATFRNYIPAPNASPERVTFFSFMSATNSHGNEISLQSSVLVAVRRQAPIFFNTTFRGISAINSFKEDLRDTPKTIQIGYVGVTFGYGPDRPNQVLKVNNMDFYLRDKDGNSVNTSPSQYTIEVKDSAGDFMNGTHVVACGTQDNSSIKHFGGVLFHGDQDSAQVQMTFLDAVWKYEARKEGAHCFFSFFCCKPGIHRISPFSHTLTLRVWDRYGNSSYIDIIPTLDFFSQMANFPLSNFRHWGDYSVKDIEHEEVDIKENEEKEDVGK